MSDVDLAALRVTADQFLSGRYALCGGETIDTVEQRASHGDCLVGELLRIIKDESDVAEQAIKRAEKAAVEVTALREHEAELARDVGRVSGDLADCQRANAALRESEAPQEREATYERGYRDGYNAPRAPKPPTYSEQGPSEAPRVGVESFTAGWFAAEDYYSIDHHEENMQIAVREYWPATGKEDASKGGAG